MVLEGEIAVPDERGVTHIDALSEAISERQSERFAFFGVVLLHLVGHRFAPLPDRRQEGAWLDRSGAAARAGAARRLKPVDEGKRLLVLAAAATAAVAVAAAAVGGLIVGLGG
jgi:hypothetical protein